MIRRRCIREGGGRHGLDWIGLDWDWIGLVGLVD